MTPHLEELASLYVLDRLENSERSEFEAQLARDPELQQLVRELEAAVERRIRSLPQYNPPRKLLSRIEAQLASASPGPARNSDTVASVTSFWPTFARWSLAAAAVIALSAATFFLLDRHRATPAPIVLVVGLDATGSTITTLPFPTGSDDADRFAQLASLAESYWTQPRKIPTSPVTSADGATAYALFDPATRQGFIGVQQLPANAAGKRYRLWVIDATSGKAWDAGVLPLNTSTRGLYSFSVDLTTKAAPAKLDFLITAEDPGSPPPARPRGEAILGENPI